jgi:hypothetical protein
MLPVDEVKIEPVNREWHWAGKKHLHEKAVLQVCCISG